MAQANPGKRLTDAALKLLAKKRWDEISLADVAKTAKVPLAQLQLLAPAKPALLGLLLRRFGAETAKRYKPDSDSVSARERLFDVALAWFDALAPQKKAVRGLYDGLKRDPLTLAAARADIVAAAAWLFVLAGADTGPAVPLRAMAFAAMLARAVPLWLDDDADLSKTMASLDRDLGRAERVFGKSKPAA
jgi:ubiquinone biosynthesis protein COQ9